jgi:hypothetical protein
MALEALVAPEFRGRTVHDSVHVTTLRDIAQVIADLPGPRPQVTEPVTPPAETRWTLLQSLVA